jgi:hypothetical protein
MNNHEQWLLWRELELRKDYAKVWKAYTNSLQKCNIILSDEEVELLVEIM